jgi:hypothetical protein
LLLALVIPLKSFAEDQTKLTPAQIVDGRSEAQVANTLIIIGRSAKDPDMLLVAAKLLSTVEAPVPTRRQPQPAASRSSTMSTVWSQRRRATPPIEAPNRLPQSRNYSGFCHYEYLCDSLSCGYEWVC